MYSQVISSAAYAASQSLKDQGLHVSRTHLIQVIAALLGYGSHAALLSENKGTNLSGHLDVAEVWVLKFELARQRAAALHVPEAVPDVCAKALKAASTIPVFPDIDTWWDEHVRIPLEDQLVDDDEVAAAMETSNATFPSSPDLDSSPSFENDLWKSQDTWEVSADGTMAGEFDPEDDHAITGHVIELSVKLTFNKAGRAGLVREDMVVSAALRDDYDDEDDLDDPDVAYERAMNNPHA